MRNSYSHMRVGDEFLLVSEGVLIAKKGSKFTLSAEFVAYAANSRISEKMLKDLNDFREDVKMRSWTMGELLEQLEMEYSKLLKNNNRRK